MKRRITGFLGNPWGQRLTLLAVIMLVMIIFQPRFFRLSNAYSIFLSIAIYGIMACGMLFVILVGGIDLCQGSAAAMAAVFMTKYVMLHGYTAGSVVAGTLIGIGFCALLGLFHGLECAYLRIPAFVLTLATQYAIYGMMNVYTESKYLQPSPEGLYYIIGSGKVLGVPMPVVIFIIYACLAAIVLGKTKFGRRVYIVGGNPEAAELLGIRSKRYVIAAYMISGVSAAVGGMVLACMNLQAAYTTASGYEGNVLTAMVVGGINLAGGEGGIPGAVFGALLVGIINNILILLNVPADYQDFVQGVIIVAAVALNVYTHRRSMGLTGVDKRLFSKTDSGNRTAAGS